MKYHYIILLALFFFGCNTNHLLVNDTQGTVAEYELLFVTDTSLVLFPVKPVRDLQGIHAEAFALPYSRISHVFHLGYSPALATNGAILGGTVGALIGGLTGGFIGYSLTPHSYSMRDIENAAVGALIGMIAGGVAGGYLGYEAAPKDKDMYLNDPKGIFFLKSISRFPDEEPQSLKEIK